jgi:hypothetical protein
MAVRVVEVHAATAIEVIDLARPLVAEIRIVADAGGADARQSRVELGFADQKGRKSSRSAKSSVTPLLVRTGTKCPHSGPASRFKMSARNLAEAHLSRAGMIV